MLTTSLRRTLKSHQGHMECIIAYANYYKKDLLRFAYADSTLNPLIETNPPFNFADPI